MTLLLAHHLLMVGLSLMHDVFLANQRSRSFQRRKNEKHVSERQNRLKHEVNDDGCGGGDGENDEDSDDEDDDDDYDDGDDDNDDVVVVAEMIMKTMMVVMTMMMIFMIMV